MNRRSAAFSAFAALASLGGRRALASDRPPETRDALSERADHWQSSAAPYLGVLVDEQIAALRASTLARRETQSRFPAVLPLSDVADVRERWSFGPERLCLDLKLTDGARVVIALKTGSWSPRAARALRETIKTPILATRRLLILPENDGPVSPSEIVVQDKLTLETTSLSALLDRVAD